jgi:hypothetical protein
MKKLYEILKSVVKETLAVNEDAKGYKNPTGGLTQKGRDHYNRKTGGNLKAPVTTPPSKLKAGSKAANRRKSFCARMSGVEGPKNKPNGEPTRKTLALRKWNCEETIIEDMKKDPCWTGYKAIGMKKKNGKTVPNCVPVKENADDEDNIKRIQDVTDNLNKMAKKPVVKLRHVDDGAPEMFKIGKKPGQSVKEEKESTLAIIKRVMKERAE